MATALLSNVNSQILRERSITIWRTERSSSFISSTWNQNRRMVSTKCQSSNNSDSTSEIKVPEGFKVPTELKKFTPRKDQLLNLAGAAVPALFRLGMGLFTLGYSVRLQKYSPETYSVLQFLGFSVIEESSIIKNLPRPERPIEIYEFEGCPFCRKVREMIAVLDLDVLYYPAPQNGPNFRPKAIQLGGKKQFPYLVDPNTGVSMYESDNIIKYLADKYGDGSVPLLLKLGIFTILTAGLGLLPRAGKGSRYVPAKLPPQPLKVWGYESSPFTKVVREALSELELPHLFHSVCRGSPKRQTFFEEKGVFQAPYLEDPNTGVKMFESAEIVDYLYGTYALSSSKSE